VSARSQNEADLYARHILEEHTRLAYSMVMRAVTHEMRALPPEDPKLRVNAVDIVHYRSVSDQS